MKRELILEICNDLNRGMVSAEGATDLIMLQDHRSKDVELQKAVELLKTTNDALVNALNKIPNRISCKDEMKIININRQFLENKGGKYARNVNRVAAVRGS